jgi:hypothetical protein
MFDGLTTAIRIWMIEDFVILQLLVYGLILLRFDLPLSSMYFFLGVICEFSQLKGISPSGENDRIG